MSIQKWDSTQQYIETVVSAPATFAEIHEAIADIEKERGLYHGKNEAPPILVEIHDDQLTLKFAGSYSGSSRD